MFFSILLVYIFVRLILLTSANRFHVEGVYILAKLLLSEITPYSSVIYEKYSIEYPLNFQKMMRGIYHRYFMAIVFY